MRDLTDDRHPWLRVPDAIALALIAAVIAAVTVDAVVESYANLYAFALLHDWAGWQAKAVPGLVDSFIVIGELMLFVALVRGWEDDRTYVLTGWGLTLAGFGMSLAGNVGHVAQAGWQTRLTFALAPVAATAGLAAGLMILKRVTRAHRKAVRARQQPRITPDAVRPDAPARPDSPKTPEPELSGPHALPGKQRRSRAPLYPGEIAAAAAAKLNGVTLRQFAATHGITKYRAEQLFKAAARRAALEEN